MTFSPESPAEQEMSRQRPGSVTGAAALGLAMALVEIAGIIQIFPVYSHLANGSARRTGMPSLGAVQFAMGLGAVFIVVLLVGAVLAFVGRTHLVLMIGAGAALGLAVFAVVNGNYYALVTVVLGFITVRLLRSESSKEFFDSRLT